MQPQEAVKTGKNTISGYKAPGLHEYCAFTRILPRAQNNIQQGTKCNRIRANEDYKLYVKVAILNCYKHSFFVRIANMWNNLPKDVVHEESLTLFRNRQYDNTIVSSFNYLYILYFTFSPFILGNLLHRDDL